MTAADSTAASGIASATFDSFSLRTASSDTVFFSSSSPPSSLSSVAVKLPLLRPALLCLFNSAIPAPTPSSIAPAIPPEGSTDTKLARILDVGLLFSLSLVNPLSDRPRVSGELSPALVSKMDRRLRTAEELRSADMAVSQCVGQ